MPVAANRDRVQKSPIPKPPVRLRYKQGDVVRAWVYDPGDNIPPVSLRAVAAKEYNNFIMCDVEALHEGMWDKVYNECYPIMKTVDRGDE